MSNQSDYRVTVTIDGQPIGAFDSRTGGEVDTDMQKRNTGEGPRIYKGRPTAGDVTVVRGYERERDHALAQRLKTRVGRAAMVVSEQPLDEDGNAWGTPITYTGNLKTVNDGEYDADSTDRRELTLVMVTRTVS